MAGLAIGIPLYVPFVIDIIAAPSPHGFRVKLVATQTYGGNFVPESKRAMEPCPFGAPKRYRVMASSRAPGYFDQQIFLKIFEIKGQ